MYHIKEKSPFLRRVSQILRVKHYAYRTEQTYIGWIKHFIIFHNKRHPDEMGENEVAAFLTYLSIHRNVSPKTQSQALNALVFFIQICFRKTSRYYQWYCSIKKEIKSTNCFDDI